MKKNIIKLWALATILVAASCGNDTEVITEDPTYTLDPNEVYVDMPEKFVYNADNILYSEDAAATFAVLLDDGVPTAEITSFPVTVRLRRALSTELTVTFTKDDTLLEKYTGEKEGFLTFPEDAFSGLSVTIPAGQTSVTSTVTLSNLTALTDTKGYLSAYKLTTDNSEVKLSSTLKPLYVKATVAEKPKAPYTLLDAVDPSWVEVPASSMLYYPEASRNLEGPEGFIKWRVEAAQIEADATLWAEHDGGIIPIVGISIHTYSTRGFKAVNLYESMDGSDTESLPFVSLTFTEQKPNLYVKFSTTRNAKAIVLGDMQFLNRRIDIKDIKLYTTR